MTGAAAATGWGALLASWTAPSILVVDDDEDIREALRLVLEDEGYSVVDVCNGQEALELLLGGYAPCLVLVDLMMPVLDGLGLYHAVLADPKISSTPMIMLTASADNSADLGVSIPVLRKPCRIEKLVEAVTRYRRQ